MISKHNAHAKSTATGKAFQEGVTAGQTVGTMIAPYVVLAVMILASVICWRLVRALWRFTR